MFWDNYERLCRWKGTTPSGAAVAVGLGKNRPSNWKKEGTLPKEDEMALLADHLGCEVCDFFKTWKTPEQAYEYHYMSLQQEHGMPVYEELGLDEYEQDMIRIYESLDRRARLRLMQAVYEFDSETEQP